MSRKQETPHSTLNNEDDGFDVAEGEIEGDVQDIRSQLAQKERDLILAAELGKALLDSNQELQSRYDSMVDEFTRKVEELQQEKHDLHLELEKMETQYQNAIKDLQDDILALRKQIRSTDKHQTTEKERCRSLREAQQNSEYLVEQLKKASSKEEELIKEVGQLKIKNESSAATIQDQIDHITMLRDQVDYLSEKLKDTNQKLLEVQGERDSLLNTVEITQEQVQVLEHKISQQDEKIHRQANDIEELQESNSDLQQQLQQRQSAQYYSLQHRPPCCTQKTNQHRNKSGNTDTSVNISHSTNVPVLDMSQENQHHHNPHIPDSGNISAITHKQSQSQHFTGETWTEDLQLEELRTVNKTFEEDSQQNITASNHSASAVLMEFSSTISHRRNISDCSVVSLTEGSRKRHHQNICGGSDEDEDDSVDRGNVCKQSLYSESSHHILSHQGSPSSFPMDSNGNQPEPSQFDNPSPYKKDRNENSLFAELSGTEGLNLMPSSENQGYNLHNTSFSNSCTPEDNTSNNNIEISDATDCIQDIIENNHNKSLFSELSPFAHEFYPRYHEQQEQSLFSELSSQLFDDRHGSGSDSSSNCMLGVFDFNSGYDSQEADHFSNESLNHSMEMRSRIESDMSCVSDWYYMTPVTTEMLEEDDFECDDDDFLVGNMAGTTLSITNSSEHGPSHYQYHVYGAEVGDSGEGLDAVDTPNEKNSSEERNPAQDQQSHQDGQLVEACRQLKDLVTQVQGHSNKPASKTLDTEETSLDMLLSLIAEMRVCINQLTDGRVEQVQSTDVTTTVPSESEPDSAEKSHDKNLDSARDVDHSSQPKESLATKNHIEESSRGAPDTSKQLRKTKSSTSLRS